VTLTSGDSFPTMYERLIKSGMSEEEARVFADYVGPASKRELKYLLYFLRGMCFAQKVYEESGLLQKRRRQKGKK